MSSKKTASSTTSHPATAPANPKVAPPETPGASPGSSAPAPAPHGASSPLAAAAATSIAPGSILNLLANSGTLAQRIEDTLSAIDAVVQELGDVGAPATALSIQDRRALPKMKKGAMAEVPAVLDVGDKYEVSVKGGSTAEARAYLQLVGMLAPFSARLTAAASLVEDVIAVSNARTYKVGLLVYSLLARLQQTFPALQTELADMASLMATKHKDAPTILRKAEAKTLEKSRETRKGKKETTTTPPAAAAPAPATGAPVAPAAPTNGAPAAAPPPANVATHA